jgi:hypothetical protein
MSELIKRNEWLKLTPQEKIERLLGRSLDDIYELLNIPLSDCDAPMLSARMQAIRCIITVTAKLGIERRRERDWASYLAEQRKRARAAGIELERAPGEGEIGEKGFFASPEVIQTTVRVSREPLHYLRDP